MTICPICKQKIDDDSYYCEHCGQELFLCPHCFPTTHKFGKGAGKRCGSCGAVLIAAKNQETGNMNNRSTLDTPFQPSQPAPQKPVETPRLTQPQPLMSPAVPSATSLFCQAMQTRIVLQDGAVIGREKGDYVSLLSTFIYISSIHARLNKTSTGWTITDLGSRNGTKVNGIPCSPTQSFSVGDIVRIANFYDFKAE